MSTLKVTTALSKFKDKAGVPLTTLTFDKAAKAYQNKIDPYEFARYEGYIQQNAYLARLAYTPCEYFCRAMKFIDYSPAFGNNALAILRKQFNQRVTTKTGSCALTYFPYARLYNSKDIHNDPTYKNCFAPFQEGDPQQKKPVGFFHQATPKVLNVYLYVHHDPQSKINPEKTLFVAFKGTSTLDELFITDILKTVVPQKMGNLTTPDNTALSGAYAHAGFVQALGKDKESIHSYMSQLLKEHPDIQKIAITGHSLGGALAILYTLALANDIARRTAAPEIQAMGGKITLVTFGAPNIFPKTPPGQPPSTGAVLFNKYLRENKIFTFDYVNSRFAVGGDIVPPILPVFSVPGEKVGLTETFSFSRAGRAQWVGNLRKGFNVKMGGTRRYRSNNRRTTQRGAGLFNKLKSAAASAVSTITGPGKNDLPVYEAMLKLYNPADPFAKDMNTQREAMRKFNGTSSADRNKIRAMVIPDNKDATKPEPKEVSDAEDKEAAASPLIGQLPPEVAADVISQEKTANSTPTEVEKTNAQISQAVEKVPSAIADTTGTVYLPNRVLYSCQKRMTGAFCHAGYFYSFVRAFSNPATVVLPTSDYTIFNSPGASGPWSEAK